MTDDDVRVRTDERRRLLGELELERNQVWRNIEWCRIRDIDREFVGKWSLGDIVGHLASHEAEVVTALRDEREGRPSGYFTIGDLDRWNADHVERKRGVDFWSLLEQLRSSRARLLDELSLISDEVLTDEAGSSQRLIRALIDHDRSHWHEIAAKLAGMAGVRQISHEPNDSATTTPS